MYFHNFLNFCRKCCNFSKVEKIYKKQLQLSGFSRFLPFQQPEQQEPKKPCKCCVPCCIFAQMCACLAEVCFAVCDCREIWKNNIEILHKIIKKYVYNIELINNLSYNQQEQSNVIALLRSKEIVLLVSLLIGEKKREKI